MVRETVSPGLHEKLKERFSTSVLEAHAQHGDETVVIRSEALLEVAGFLKAHPEFDMNVLMDVTAVDGLELKWAPRFHLVYHFFSLSKNHRLRVKVPVEDKPLKVASLSVLWPSANWFEREVWDMFGIGFENHPDLRRLLMYPEFKGHPLRKDYPYNQRQPLIGPEN